MSIFKKAKTEGMEEVKDTLGGGGGYIKESDIYLGEIKVAYITPTKKGGVNVNLELALEDGSDYRETLFVMNENNEVFFTSNNKRIPYMGYTRINDICLLTLEKELTEVDMEDRTLSIYDFESKKDVPREVPVLVELIGEKVAVAIQQIRENKQVADDKGVYHPTNEERMVNNIVAVFHPEEKFTVNEGINQLEPEFWDKWLEKNKGVVYDKYKEVKERGNTRGASSASTGDKPARKSMFNKK